MNTCSLSKISISCAVTSPCTNNGISTRCIAAKTSVKLATSVTPEDELVVAPAGYNFAANTKPDSLASIMSWALVLSVKYKNNCPICRTSIPNHKGELITFWDNINWKIKTYKYGNIR